MKPSAFSQLSRRRFLARGGVAAAGVLGFPAITRCASPNNRLGIAIIGVGGRGGGNMAEVAATEDIVALCDVNAATLGEAARPMMRQGSGRLAAAIVEVSAGPGFRSAGVAPLSPTTAVILVGGLRELTAQTVEDDQPMAGMIEPAVSAAIALLGGPR